MTERREKGLYWDRAWKLVEGCTKVSAGCKNCWSESETKMRAGHNNEKISTRAQAVISSGVMVEGERVGVGFHGGILCRTDNLDLPLRTKKPTVFAIWNDLFHGEVPDDFRDKAYAVMALCPQHTFLVLTKRPELMAEYFSKDQADMILSWSTSAVNIWGGKDPDSVFDSIFHAGSLLHGRIWHGTTAENQEMADKRIPHLLQVPGKRFLSIEPMLGPVNLENVDPLPNVEHKDVLLALDCLRGHMKGPDDIIDDYKIHAVLLGGESGKGARPMHPDWVRQVRDQCAEANVPFFFKQWGEWVSELPARDWEDPDLYMNTEGRTATEEEALKGGTWDGIHRVGKKKAGRMFDGCPYNELPWAE